jgi:hypothetical protein
MKRTRFGNGRRGLVDDIVDRKWGRRGREVQPDTVERDSALNPCAMRMSLLLLSMISYNAWMLDYPDKGG